MFTLVLVLTSAASMTSSSSSSSSSSLTSSIFPPKESTGHMSMRDKDFSCQEMCRSEGICSADGLCDCSLTSFSGPACDEDSIAYKFEHPGGIIIITLNSSKHTKTDHVIFGMMTHQSDAILLSIESSPSADFIVFELTSGCIHVQFNMGLGNLHVGDPVSKVNNGMYHVIKFSRKGQNSSLQIDNGPVCESRPTGKQLSIFNAQKIINIGGQLKKSSNNISKVYLPYHGVVAGLSINGEWLLETAAIGDPRMNFIGDVELYLTPHTHYFESMFRQEIIKLDSTNITPPQATTNRKSGLQEALNDRPTHKKLSENIISEEKENSDIKVNQLTSSSSSSPPPLSSLSSPTIAPSSSTSQTSEQFLVPSVTPMETFLPSLSKDSSPLSSSSSSRSSPSLQFIILPSSIPPSSRPSKKLPYSFSHLVENTTNFQDHNKNNINDDDDNDDNNNNNNDDDDDDDDDDDPQSMDRDTIVSIPVLVVLVILAAVIVTAAVVLGFKTRCFYGSSDSGSYRLESRRMEVGVAKRAYPGVENDVTCEEGSLGCESPIKMSRRSEKRRRKSKKNKKLVDREWYV